MNIIFFNPAFSTIEIGQQGKTVAFLSKAKQRLVGNQIPFGGTRFGFV